MNRALLNRVLQGDQEAMALFGEPEHCAVIDWRAGLAEIVEAVTPFLPENYLKVERSSEAMYQLIVSGAPSRSASISPALRQEALLVIVNDALKPDFELRHFGPADGDGYSLIVAPRSEWSKLEQAHPQATKRLFLSAERLAAYWQKSFFARLFSKP